MRVALTLLLLCFAYLAQATNYILFEENGKKGIKDQRGQVIIPPSFEALGWSDGSFSVIGETTGYRLQNHWGLINLKKEFITQAEFEELVYQGGEYVVARKKLSPVASKLGCVNLRGEILLPFVYDGIKVQGLRAVVFNYQNGRFNYGLTNLKNSVLIPLDYRHIFSLGSLRYAVENREGKFALFGEDGKAITPFNIDSVSSFYRGYSILYQRGLQGLINRDGEVKVMPVFQFLRIEKDGRIFGRHPGEWIYLDEKNAAVAKLSADDLRPVSNKKTILKKGNKFGVINDVFEHLVPVEWDSLTEIRPHFFLGKKNNKWGVVQSNNQIRVPIVYDSLAWYGDSYRAFLKTAGWQLLDENGKAKSGKAYHAIEQFNDATWKVRNGIFWGLLNKDGSELVHCVFDSIGDRTKNLVAVKFKGLYGIIDLRENWRVAPQPFPIQLGNDTRYLEIQPDNSFLKSLDGKVIYFTPYKVDLNENYWVECAPNGDKNVFSYEGVKLLAEGINNTSASNTTNGALTEFQMSEGLRAIRRDGKYGFIDTKGKLRIANRYDSVRAFKNGLAAVNLIGMWGFINSQDKIVVQPNYEYVSIFENGLAIVKRKNKMGLIDMHGQVVVPLRYSLVRRLATGDFLLAANHLFGFANKKGKIEIEPRFDKLQVLDGGQLLVSQAAKWGLISSSGLDIIPMQYDKLQFDANKKQYLAFRKSEWQEIEVK